MRRGAFRWLCAEYVGGLKGLYLFGKVGDVRSCMSMTCRSRTNIGRREIDIACAV